MRQSFGYISEKLFKLMIRSIALTAFSFVYKLLFRALDWLLSDNANH